MQHYQGPHKYELRGDRTPRGGFKGHLYEDGFQIARVTRGTQWWAQEYTVKWFSERAYYRFQDFCNCLSVDETLDALEPGKHVKV